MPRRERDGRGGGVILALALLYGIWADLPPAPITAPLPAWQWADLSWTDRWRAMKQYRKRR